MIRRRLVVVLPLALAAGPLLPAARTVVVDQASQARAGIRSMAVERRAFASHLPVVGEIVRVPGRTALVRTIVDGRVIALHVAPGRAVAAGEALLRIHSYDVQRMEAELLNADAAWRLAKTRLAAGEQLLRVEGIAEIEVERRRQEALRARLQRERARHELEDLGYTEEELAAAYRRRNPEGFLEIKSPLAGVVLAVHVQEHEWFRSYDPLVEVGDPRQVELQLQLEPADVVAVARGDEIVFSAVGRPELGGRAQVITQVPQVDPETRTVTVRAGIVEWGAALPPGVYVQGTLRHGEERLSCAVPESAVIRIGGADHVFVRIGPERFEARPVRLGTFGGGVYEVLAGVEEGEEVVVGGVFLLKSTLLAAGS